jgi:putative transposase
VSDTSTPELPKFVETFGYPFALFSMPRPPRLIVPGLPHHVTQRGNYRQEVFFRDEDRQSYLQMLKEYSREYGIAIQAFCLMSNHVHLVATPQDRDGLPRLLQRLHSGHARALHWRLQRTGHLWQARYGSVVLDECHFWTAMIYVEQNPVRAGLVHAAGDWLWSSAAAHLKNAADVWLDLSAWRLRFNPESWKRCLQLGLADAQTAERLREATRSGWPLGSDDFLDRLEREHHAKVRKAKPGPKVAKAAAAGN